MLENKINNVHIKVTGGHVSSLHCATLLLNCDIFGYRA